jgi:3-oxoacyl-[acyl-carrier protein] reductase
MSRIALITGGARGIGAAIARCFSNSGYDIVLNYNRSELAATKLVEEISGRCKAASFQADVSQPAEVENLFAFCMSQFGRLDVLVNNASYSSPVGWAAAPDAIDWVEWQRTIDIDLKGSMLCSHAAFKIMQPQGSGKIINFSSSAALWGDVPTYLYTAAKSAVVGITRALARAFAPSVQVNCIAPGSIATDWIQNWKLTEQDLQAIHAETPLGRIGKPEEVAELAAFIASPTCTFITGQTFVIDGGILLS